ncbi:MAG: TAXI family TRAP transporter solute-binding subunit [Galactobacter sp.]
MSISRRHLLRSALAGSAVAMTLGLSACDTSDRSARLRLASGERGGNYHRFAQLLRDAAARTTSLTVAPVATNGSAENLALLRTGKAQLALCLADTAAVKADGAVAIGRVYQNYLQGIVRTQGNISSIEDLRDRPISIGAPGSGASFTVRRLLAAARIPPDHVEEHPLAEALDRLDAGELDACFWSGGLPTPLIDRGAHTAGRRLLDLSTALDALQQHYPDVYLQARVPTGVYGSNTPLVTVGVPSLLLTSRDLPNAIVRALVDVLIEEAHALVPQESIGVQFLTPSDLIDTGSLALHPAARARYQERYG